MSNHKVLFYLLFVLLLILSALPTLAQNNPCAGFWNNIKCGALYVGIRATGGAERVTSGEVLVDASQSANQLTGLTLWRASGAAQAIANSQVARCAIANVVPFVVFNNAYGVTTALAKVVSTRWLYSFTRSLHIGLC